MIHIAQQIRGVLRKWSMWCSCTISDPTWSHVLMDHDSWSTGSPLADVAIRGEQTIAALLGCEGKIKMLLTNRDNLSLLISLVLQVSTPF